MPRYLFDFGKATASVIAPTPEKAVAYLVERLNDVQVGHGYDLDLGGDPETRDRREYVRVDTDIIPETITKDHICKVDLEIDNAT